MATHADAPTSAVKADAAKSASVEPIVIKLGKKNRKQVRKLRRGKPGRLLERVEEAIDHLRTSGEMSAQTQPVVIVIRERAKDRGRRLARAWGLG